MIYAPTNAADAVVEAIRMTLRPRGGEMPPKKYALEIDGLTAEGVRVRGDFDGAVVPTVACTAAVSPLAATSRFSRRAVRPITVALVESGGGWVGGTDVEGAGMVAGGHGDWGWHGAIDRFEGGHGVVMGDYR